MPEVAEQPAATDQDAGQVVEGNYVSDVLMDPNGPQSISQDEPDLTQQGDDQTVDQPAEETTDQPEEAAGTLSAEQLTQNFAKALGLNPNDPRDQKILKQLVDKESFIRTLKGENKQLRDTAPTHMTEFERQLAEREKPASTEQQQQTTTTTASQPSDMKIGDVGDEWKKAEDGVEALEKAWALTDPEQRRAKVTQVENAIFFRRLAVQGIPLMNFVARNAIAEALQKELQPLMKDVTPLVEQQAETTSRDYALAQLKQVPQFAQIDKLLEPSPDGGTITIDGEEFPNNPLNQIVAENPWILSIKHEHKDPNTARILTKMDQYRAVYQIMQKTQKQGIDPKQAATLVEAGKLVAARTAKDRVRQGVNSGSGGRGSRGDQSYVESLVNGPPGSSASFSTLIDK